MRKSCIKKLEKSRVKTRGTQHIDKAKQNKKQSKAKNKKSKTQKNFPSFVFLMYFLHMFCFALFLVGVLFVL